MLTGAEGEAAAGWTLGTETRTNRLAIEAEGVASVDVTVRATPASPIETTLTVEPASAVTAQETRLVIRARDRFGNPVPDAVYDISDTVRVGDSRGAGLGFYGGDDQPKTDSAGEASLSAWFYAAGTWTVVASSPEWSTSAALGLEVRSPTPEESGFTWTDLGPVPDGRHGISVAADSTVYLLGRCDQTGSRSWRYDTDARSWVEVGSPPFAGPCPDGLAVATPEGVHVVWEDDKKARRHVVGDPLTGTWVERAPPPELGIYVGASPYLSPLSVLAREDTLYLLGRTSWAMYQPDRDAWSEFTGGPYYLWNGVSGIVDGGIFVVDDYPGRSGNEVTRLDLTSRQWQSGFAPLPPPVEVGGGGVVRGADDRLCVVGLAFTGLGRTRDTYCFDGASNVWEPASAAAFASWSEYPPDPNPATGESGLFVFATGRMYLLAHR